MCGIVGGISERNIVPILLEGLRRLEYRGYDSAGIALLSPENIILRQRSLGKIANLAQKITETSQDFAGKIGIAHTRWATHGQPSENNAHPHICNNEVAIVHNGIIENYETLKAEQQQKKYRFTSETDTEVIAHALHETLQHSENNLLEAVQKVTQKLKGAYALGVISPKDPQRLIAARQGSPLVIGVGIGEYFIASDVSALLPVTQQFIYLEEGDVADLRLEGIQIYNQQGQKVQRPIKQSHLTSQSVELGQHRHYMHKEIYEQPQAVIDTLEGRVSQTEVFINAFGFQAQELFKTIKQVQLIACGTSYHAGMVAKYWFEDILQLPTQVEVASEFRYRHPVILENTLFVTLSQSGETADTLASLKQLKQLREEKSLHIPTLAICNVAESSLTRESDLTFLTHAGPEIGVASTKAFTTQLVALALLLTALGKTQSTLSQEREQKIITGLHKLPALILEVLKQEEMIQEIAQDFADKHNALFLGRGTLYPIAMEGALKLKEISYIHAEAYPAGELKHGPLALIEENIPVVAIAPKDELLEKLKANLEEIKARGGKMIVFEDERAHIESPYSPQIKVIKAAQNVGRITAPITFNIPLQLLAYHVALIKGTDVDQPRNLAKSVTVE